MLDVEIKFLEAQREKLLKQYGGQYLVIKGEEVTGAFDSMTAALEGAALQHGIDNVLIRRPNDTQTEVSIPALTLGILNAGNPHSNSGPSPGPRR